jgi:hypothetical protein
VTSIMARDGNWRIGSLDQDRADSMTTWYVGLGLRLSETSPKDTFLMAPPRDDHAVALQDDPDKGGALPPWRIGSVRCARTPFAVDGSAEGYRYSSKSRVYRLPTKSSE